MSKEQIASELVQVTAEIEVLLEKMGHMTRQERYALEWACASLPGFRTMQREVTA